jgi:putative DNA primase/helicase
MNENNNPDPEPTPIDPSAYSYCYQAAEKATSASTFSTVREAIRQIPPIDLNVLAETSLGIPAMIDGKRTRLSTSTLAILVAEQLPVLLQAAGLGMTVLNGAMHIYGGTHWVRVEEKEAQVLLGEAGEQLGAPRGKCRQYKVREEFHKQFLATKAAASATPATSDAFINCLNGTLVVSDGAKVFRAHDAGDFLTHVLPYRHDPGAVCPMFEAYLRRVLPDEQSRQVVAEFLGWTFLTELKLEKILVLLGEGHNGKSVLFDVINALLGEDNISSVGLKELTKFEHRGLLAGKLLNFGSEISDNCNADLLKRLASGEPIEARQLYENIFIMRRYARLAFNANQLPREVEQSTGFFRRFLIVPFTQTITAEEKDPDLARKIIASELPGVLNWVLEGMHRLQAARKFSDCAASDEALETYRRESDSVAYFMAEKNWIASATQKKLKSDFYSHYRDFCYGNGLRAVSAISFGRRLKRFAIPESKSGNARYWHVEHNLAA